MPMLVDTRPPSSAPLVFGAERIEDALGDAAGSGRVVQAGQR